MGKLPQELSKGKPSSVSSGASGLVAGLLPPEIIMNQFPLR